MQHSRVARAQAPAVELNSTMVSPMLDRTVANALRGTAVRLERDLDAYGFAKVGEAKHLQPAFREALTAAGVADVQRSEKRLSFKSWEPEGVKGRLGGIDVVVGRAPEYRAFFELKWAYSKGELGWTLWDIYKLAAARIEYGVEAYAIVGAPLTYWADDDVDCSALYCDGVWDSRQLFARYARAWKDLLRGGKARPIRVPASISTRVVAAEPIRSSPGWELRALAIEIPSSDWLEFVGDWPAPEDHVAADA